MCRGSVAYLLLRFVPASVCVCGVCVSVWYVCVAVFVLVLLGLSWF